MQTWLLFLYRVPAGPTARRVYVWRKLQRLGAILAHDAAWVLPDTPRTREQFKWLAAEIIEMGGEAQLWESRSALAGQEDGLRRQFVEQAEAAYRAILAQLEKADSDPAALSQQFQQIRQQDYFQSKLGQQVREALIAARGSRDA
jgi:hypothetical protein